MKYAAPLILAFALSLLTGCVSQPYADRSGPLDDPATLQKIPTIEAVKLLPLTPSEGSFMPTLTENLEDDERVPFRFTSTADGWAWSLKDLRVIYYKATPEGTVITREDDLEEEVAVYYDPAIPILPNNLAADAPIKGTTNMVVKGINSGNVQNKGKCDYTVELLGRHNIWTPRGVIDAVIIRNTRAITLKFVTVTVSITTAYAYTPLAKSPAKGASVGQVGERVHQIIKPLGLFEDESNEELRLAPDKGKPIYNPKPVTTQPSTQPRMEPAK